MNEATVIQADRLSRHYTVSQGWLKPKGTVRALSDASFTLSAGRTLAVVGESGCGKSTLARQLTLIEPPTGGKLVLGGIDVAQASKEQLKTLRTRVQMVFQNPYASLNPRHTVGTQIGEPLAINENLAKAERRDRVRAIMARVGLRPEHDARYPHMFSGGQRQRIAVARAMILKPEIVVADEPTSALDVSIQAQVLNLFMDLQQELGTAYVFISHNLSVVEHIADDVMVMYLGRVVERGPKAQVFAQPLHPYTHTLLAATPTLDGPRRAKRIRIESEPPSPLNPPSGCAFHGRCPHADAQCSQQLPEPRLIDSRWVACHHVERITD
ncbi:MAG TPA: dipeptide ABC transporter ATP-binding protein [Bordetella sp.]